MTLRKTLLALAAAALVSVSAWAPAGATPTNNPGSKHRSPQGNQHAGGNGGPSNPGEPKTPGKSHKCKPHAVAYVASGTLVSQTLTKNADGTYSGELTVEVTQTNHHAAGDKAKTKDYTVERVHVTFGLAAPAKGDRVKLIGKITTLAKKCPVGEFKSTTTIRKIVFHAPSPPKP